MIALLSFFADLVSAIATSFAAGKLSDDKDD